ncbi:MAG: hypothetical protein IPP69_08745 [Flavobacteriales bacterium]|nr:hypothetical protein [Flavobacteriales bacterium]
MDATGAIGGSYVWSPAAGLDDFLIPNPQATIIADQTYFVTGTDLHGCIDQDHVSLTVLPLPQISAQAVAQICPGTSVELIASGSAGSYSWSPLTGLSTPNDSTTLTTLTETSDIQLLSLMVVIWKHQPQLKFLLKKYTKWMQVRILLFAKAKAPY